MRARFTQPLYVLLAIALLVLVIACLNLASLMVARGVAAGHDIGVRMALGAARLRVMRAVVVEGMLLAIGGGFAGALCAMWISDALAKLILQDFTVRATLDVTPDARVDRVHRRLDARWRRVVQPRRCLARGPSERHVRARDKARARRRPPPRRTMAGGGASRRVVGAARPRRPPDSQPAAGARGLFRNGCQRRGGRVPERAAAAGIGTSTTTATSAISSRASSRSRVCSARRSRTSSQPAEASAVESSWRRPNRRRDADSVSRDVHVCLTAAVRRAPHADAGRPRLRLERSLAPRVESPSSARRSRNGSSKALPALGQRVRVGIHPRRQDIEIVGVVGDAHIYDLEGSQPGQHLRGVAAGAGAR